MLQITEADADAEVRTGWVLDNFPKNFSQMDALQQGEILPDIIFCLKDSGGNQGRRHRNKASQTSRCFSQIYRLMSAFMCHFIALQCVEQF